MVLLQTTTEFYDDFFVFSTPVIWSYSLFAIILLIAEWRIFEKAGKPGWAVIIPIYNVLVLLEIIGKPWWWILLLLVPGVNFIIGIWMTNLLSKSFGYGVGFTLGLIFLSLIFILILGFDKAEYQGPAGAQRV